MDCFYSCLFVPVSGREIDPHKLGIVSYRGSEDKKPFMVGFFSSQEMVYPHRTRTALRRRRELYSYREEQEKYQYPLSRKSHFVSLGCTILEVSKVDIEGIGSIKMI
jgi:hypothetical protein